MPQPPARISFVVPVFNRRAEVEELLDSMTRQTRGGFGVILVEDGSTDRCEDVAAAYADRLDVQYFFKPNSGPGQSRNYGFERAQGDYCIFLDSDCVLPPGYFAAVTEALAARPLDAFGGPDRAREDFTDVQKAIDYAMTSPLTTGGIRGSSEKLEKFHPRSFNMGYSREVFKRTGGFSKLRFGEDIDMSIRIHRAGFSTGLIREAYVYHKRRATLRQFFKQVHNSGIARINLYKLYPDSLRIVHWAPAVFTVGLAGALVLGWVVGLWTLIPFAAYAALLFIGAFRRTRSPRVAALATVASFVMLVGYGTGFLTAAWRRLVLGQDIYTAFERSFYD